MVAMFSSTSFRDRSESSSSDIFRMSERSFRAGGRPCRCSKTRIPAMNTCADWYMLLELMSTL